MNLLYLMTFNNISLQNLHLMYQFIFSHLYNQFFLLQYLLKKVNEILNYVHLIFQYSYQSHLQVEKNVQNHLLKILYDTHIHSQLTLIISISQYF